MLLKKSKPPKSRKGRLKELEHQDIVEIKWVDATSCSRWTRSPVDEEPMEAITVGYLEGFKYDKKYGDFVVLKGSETETDTKALLSSIPVSNVTEFRLISKGKKKNDRV